MIENPPCPVCEGSEWEEIGKRHYSKDAADQASEYVRRRFEVLFELWFPGEESVTLKSQMCSRCGFVAYSPRPSEADLDAKYRHLTSTGTGIHGPSAGSPGEIDRAKRLWRMCRRYFPPGSLRVLDFGGGDGRLVAPFASHGHQCFLLDYGKECVLGVIRLGATLDELPPEERFHAIICSHVIEHVANPYDVLVSLYNQLEDSGAIYIEVPLEIWRKAPLHEEPVTHVNFFTPHSMKVLLARSGFVNLNVRLNAYPHPSGHRAVVISAFARRWTGQQVTVDCDAGPPETRSLLEPGFRRRVQRAMLDPLYIPSKSAYWIASRIMGR